MSEIQKTTDYSIFKKHPSNRAPDADNLKKLTASIQARNLLQYRPILVDAAMQVIDGQHRLQVAKLLGLEVFYQVQQDCTHEDIILLNQHQKGWKIGDYVDYYISLGKTDYLSLKRLREQLKCTYNFIVRMLCSGSGRHYETVRVGKFHYFTPKEIYDFQIALEKTQETTKVLMAVILNKNQYIKTERFQCALCHFIKNQPIDFDVFLSKLRIKSESVKPCSSLLAYQEMFLNIYNWKNQSPIELKSSMSR